jgi:hypothetical protein
MIDDMGFLEYKCRRCGEIGRNSHVPSIQSAVIGIVAVGKTPWTGMVGHILDVHSCADGGLGVSDLIGGRATNAKPLETR